MSFTDLFIKRPVLACVVSLMILLFGLRALSTLELRQFPKMDNTVITITTTYPGANSDLMQGFITAPIEKSVASADGIDYLTSQSVEGMSVINAYIRLNFDPHVAMTDIMAKVSEVSNQLPKESNEPVILKSTGSQTALMYIGYSSKHMSNEQITDYLSRVIQPNLQTVAGVSNAEIIGGQIYAMRIWLDTDKMAALQVAAADVVHTLQSQNFQTAAGQTKGKYVLFNINAKTNLENPAQFKEMVIKNINGTLIRLKDIGTVELGAENYDSSVKFNGQNGVFIGIEATPTANPLTVINDVKKILPQIAINYPPELDSKIVYDSTDYIRSSIHEVIISIIEATIIVILVIFAFIGAVQAVSIPVITIPLSLIGVCSLMFAMGYSINLLTLLAMVIAIGLVVDDAIVVVENIYRHIEEGLTPHEAALKGAREIAGPIISMTTTLAAVYAPIGFMTGLTGALFKEFAFTLSFSVILSGIIALTLSPMMCSKLLNSSMMHQKLVIYIDSLFDHLKHGYARRLHMVVENRAVVVAFAVIMLIGCLLIALTTKTELAPDEDQSILFMQLSAPKYANIDYTTKFTDLLPPMFESIPETEDFFVFNGSSSVNNAIAGLILKPWDQRDKSQAQVLPIVQGKIKTIAGLNAVAFPLPSLPTNSSGMPVQFVLTSTDDYTAIYQVIKKLEAAAMQSGLFMFVDSDLRFEKPMLEVHVDNNKAASMGVNMDNIGSTLAILLGGNYINRFSIYGQSYQVIPQVFQEFRYNPYKINDYYVTTNSGHSVPLASVVNLKMTTQPNELYRFQQLNSATLSGMVMPGTSITEGLAFLQQEALKTLPAGFGYDYAGQSRQVIQEGYTMIYTFFFALIIIYLVLAAQFESFRDPFIILISVPLSIIGALLPLHLGLATLNIYTGIGLVTLIGLISKHGILIVEFANQLQEHEGLNARDAVIKSSMLRLRPILMTTVAMVLGVLPLILASGAGAKSRFDIGLVIAAGMLIGTCFTLFVVPTMYTIFARKTIT
ncbi:MAG TPA: efflux RND transporter permease subunit [Gammaproteobacteria bacterium]|nr:efflux RND transporter permease subunit [Gammaproteobacteria bacterium]